MSAGADRVPLDSRLRSLLERGRSLGGPAMYELPVAEVRARIAGGNAMCADGPPVGSVEQFALPGTGLRARRYRPAGAAPAGVLVYFHGGGWVTGDLDYSDNICRHLVVGAGLEVVSVDYRLAPEWPFPAAADDAVAAVRAVAAGATGSPLLVGGDSAGGNLAAGAALRLRGEVEISAQVLVYPVLDSDTGRGSYLRSSSAEGIATREMEWFLDHYCPEAASRAAPEFSPLGADLAGLPPTVLMVVGHDPLRDEGVDYAERLRRARVPVELIDHPAMNHGFFRFESVLGDYAARAAAELSAAVVRALPPSPPRVRNGSGRRARGGQEFGDVGRGGDVRA